MLKSDYQKKLDLIFSLAVIALNKKIPLNVIFEAQPQIEALKTIRNLARCEEEKD